ncbi:transmembrane protein 233-like [Liolophura sinensis]|uniref:transmembrane protein 233-like n=1 Tax=Liolophura sinensis TaxID=3198878 RepID=UPI00315899D9
MSVYPDKEGYGQQYPSAGYSHNTTVVTTQPNVTYVQANNPPPNNHMALAIVSCLCCFWPLGLVAIIFSSMSADAARSGDYDTAQTKAKVSLGLSISAIIVGVLTVTIILIVYFTVGFYTTTTVRYYG